MKSLIFALLFCLFCCSTVLMEERHSEIKEINKDWEAIKQCLIELEPICPAALHGQFEDLLDCVTWQDWSCSMIIANDLASEGFKQVLKCLTIG